MKGSVQSSLASEPIPIAGVMTGTSCDGVDAVVAHFQGAFPELTWKLVAWERLELPSRVREIVRSAARGVLALEEYGELENLVSEAILNCLKRLALKAPFQLAGIHGQTLWHLPRGLHPFTHQVLDPYRICESLKIPVVWDFRRGDLAQGGEGAPLTPLAHLYLFHRSCPQGTGFLNLGGFANYTFLGGKIPEEILAWDTGPGMSLLDLVVQELLGIPYDPEGSLSRKGKVHPQLLEELLAHPYFLRPPPKSTGKEEFGPRLLEKIREGYPHLPPHDLLATLVEWSARSIARELSRTPGLRTLYLYGGGVKHRVLVEAIARNLPHVECHFLEELGVPSHLLEPLAFALLAYERWQKRPGNFPWITGAGKAVLLGSLAEPLLG